jgi:tripartite-type tricarboxylate transporter receptor subunit TctC
MGKRSLSLLTAGVLVAAFGMTAEPAWSESWPELGLFGAKDMRADLCERVASQVRLVLNEQEIQTRLTSVGLITRGTSPAEFATLMDAQRAKWSAIAREHNIEPQ